MHPNTPLQIGTSPPLVGTKCGDLFSRPLKFKTQKINNSKIKIMFFQKLKIENIRMLPWVLQQSENRQSKIQKLWNSQKSLILIRKIDMLSSSLTPRPPPSILCRRGPSAPPLTHNNLGKNKHWIEFAQASGWRIALSRLARPHSFARAHARTKQSRFVGWIHTPILRQYERMHFSFSWLTLGPNHPSLLSPLPHDIINIIDIKTLFRLEDR